MEDCFVIDAKAWDLIQGSLCLPVALIEAGRVQKMVEDCFGVSGQAQG